MKWQRWVKGVGGGCGVDALQGHNRAICLVFSPFVTALYSIALFRCGYYVLSARPCPLPHVSSFALTSISSSLCSFFVLFLSLFFFAVSASSSCGYYVFLSSLLVFSYLFFYSFFIIIFVCNTPKYNLTFSIASTLSSGRHTSV